MTNDYVETGHLKRSTEPHPKTGKPSVRLDIGTTTVWLTQEQWFQLIS